jgi:hypothetical protein
MTRQEQLSIFNAALTGLIANGSYDTDPKAMVRLAAEYVRTADGSTVVDSALLATS